MPTLSEIVSSALEQVSEKTASVKLASSSDVPQAKPTPFEVKLAAPKPIEKVATKAEVLDDSAYALKLASCLEVAGTLVLKLAEEASTAEELGNAVSTLESVGNEPVSLPPAPKGPVEQTVTTEAATTEGIMPDNEDDHTGDPDWTGNKEAAYEAINHKIAQAELLEQLGQHEKAAELIGEAEKLSVSNKWIANKLVNGVKDMGGVIGTAQKLTPFGKTRVHAGLAAAQAAGGKKARNAIAQGLARTNRNVKLHGWGAAQAKNTPVVEKMVSGISEGVGNRTGALREAIRKTASDSSPLVVEGETISNMLPDNAGAIALTRAQARLKSQQEASAFFTQSPQKDPVVEEELEHTEGAKISSLLDAVEKTAAANKWRVNSRRS